MARLIDADKIPYEECYVPDGDIQWEYKKALIAEKTVIDQMPTVDAVEVVRCKDCKHWLKDVPGCTDAIGRCRFGNYMVGAAGYCVYGERRSDEVD